jgi:ParB family chromosome partitioning protein
MKAPKITPMSERRHEMIPIDRIKVLNSRNRNKVKFQENVRSIKEIGLRKYVIVSDRVLKKTGFYELVCGQGRYLAYKQLGRTHIPAEVRSCSKKDALLLSLVENIARVSPKTMWFAREVKRMHDAGWGYADISRIACRSETYIRDFIRLVEQGEERLIKGVEQGLFPMTFALQVARSDDATVQNVLMDAFDKGMINSSNMAVVRKIVECRIRHGKDLKKQDLKPRVRLQHYSVKHLQADISRRTKEKESFVRESSAKENRLLALLDGLKTLWMDRGFLDVAKAEGLGQRPKLEGTYNV